MAKYTMLLAEYLAKGGALPSSFALIEGFEDLFVAKYCDKEIGFETDALFAIKLDLKAKLVMQAYADRIAERAYYWAKVENPTKVYYEKTTIKTNLGEQRKSGTDTSNYGAKSGTNTTNIGAQTNTTTELPFDANNAEPNTIVNNGARSDSVSSSENAHVDSVSSSETIDAVENNDLRETRKEDNGETIDEVMRMLDFLNKDISTLVEKCLNEFKPLFMGVY